MGQNLTLSSYSRSIPARTYGAQKKDDSGNASRIGLALKKWSGLRKKVDQLLYHHLIQINRLRENVFTGDA